MTGDQHGAYHSRGVNLCRMQTSPLQSLHNMRSYCLHTWKVENSSLILKTGSIFGWLRPIECTDFIFPCWIYHLLIPTLSFWGSYAGEVSWKFSKHLKASVFLPSQDSLALLAASSSFCLHIKLTTMTNNFHLHWMFLHSSTEHWTSTTLGASRTGIFSFICEWQE